MIKYNTTKSIYGIKIKHSGCIDNYRGGVIEKYSFVKSDYGDQVAFYPKKGMFIPSGSGILFEIEGDLNVACLTEIIIMADGGFTITSDYNKIFGCTNPKSCNYNSSATVDDNTCESAQLFYDCEGNCIKFDECNICGGDNSSCSDCNGIPYGNALLDNCNICDNNPNNDCIQDCAGIWGGRTMIDECNICGGDNSICSDCLGIPNGNNKLDMCNICDNDLSNDCIRDCSGIWGGNAKIDDCEVCISKGEKNKTEWNNSCQDCKGIVVDGLPGPNYIDKCGICDSNPNNDCVQDCAGKWGGKTIVDECGVCGGKGIKPGRCDCAGTLIDCMGVCGGGSKLDRCRVCNGNNKSCGATYLWPTNASKTLTAFFGEERPRRYHAGIDIRTYGRNGYDLYAISNGYIKRIKTGSEGYGKTIYLQLYDGNVAVYAHLERFTTELDIIIKQLQEKLGSYTIDYTFNNDNLKYNKGDVIGYTGDTGSISGPHLHFEIRDENGLAINPLHEFPVYDNISPIPQNIAFIPFDSKTSINSHVKKQIFSLIKKNDAFFLKDTVRITGPFGIALSAIDKINKQPFSYGIYSIELFIDESRIYDVKYDMYNFDESKYIYCERDFGLKKETGDTFYSLYANHEDETSFFVGDNSHKYINFIDNEYHDMKIIINDFNGNSSTVNGVIINKELENINCEYNYISRSIEFTPKLIDSVKYDFILSGKYIKDKQYAIDGFSIINDTLIIPKDIEPPINILEIIPRYNDGTRNNSQFIEINSPIELMNDREFKIDQYDKFVLLVINELYFSNLEAEISFNTSGNKTIYPMERFDRNTLISNPFNFDTFRKFDTLSIVFNSEPESQVTFPINQTLATSDKNFELSYNAKELVLKGRENTVYDSTIIWSKATNASIENLNNAQIVGGPYFVGPDNISFNKSVDLFISVVNPESIKNSAIYYYNEQKKDWYYMDSLIKKNMMIKTYIYSGGIFAAIQEKNPPKLYNIFPSGGGKYYQNDLKSISFNIKDDLSGIDGEKDITLRINNGKPLIFEYNSYQDKVYYRLEKSLEKGQHELLIIAFDRAGNQTTRIENFEIK